jgi:hypothetical protein
MKRRRVVEVPPEWLRPRKGDGNALRRAKRTVTAKLEEHDYRRVLAGKMANGYQA